MLLKCLAKLSAVLPAVGCKSVLFYLFYLLILGLANQLFIVVMKQVLDLSSYIFCMSSRRDPYPAMVAWSVERLLHKKCHLLAVDQISLGEID